MRHLLLELLYGCLSAFLLLFVDLLVDDLRDVQLEEGLFFWLLELLLVALEELMLLQFFLLGWGGFLGDFWGFHQHLFDFFLAQDDVFFCDGFDPSDLSCLCLSECLLFWQGRVLLEHDFLILLLLHLDLPPPLLRQVLAGPRFDLLILNAQLLLEPSDPLLLAFSFPFLLLAVFLLLTCYDMRTFSRSRRSH